MFAIRRAWEAAREAACEVAVARLPEALASTEAYIGEAMHLEETLRERMGRLPPHEFEPLLHAVFQEDEWKLVLVGGVLGAALGALQSYSFGALGLG